MNPKLPEITPGDYVALIRARFLEEGDPATAEGQMRYMRNRYAFCGLKAPHWVGLCKEIFAEYGIYDGAKLKTFARRCFADEYREVFFAGLQMVEKRVNTQPAGFIEFLEEAIIKGDWWDTVDWISKFVGIHFLRYPELQHPYCEKWIGSDNIWLQRVAIIHQLMYKDKTDETLLFEMILRRKDSKEFFVQKGAGWGLRQYSKINPIAVVRFLDRHAEIAPLTRREGLKWLRRQQS
jgi:3-methyladenine DNA glycosylase AlkD